MFKIQIPADKTHRLLSLHVEPAAVVIRIDYPFVLDESPSFASPPPCFAGLDLDGRYSTVTLRSSPRAGGTNESILNWPPGRMSMSARCSVPTRREGELISISETKWYISPPLSRCMLRCPKHSHNSRRLATESQTRSRVRVWVDDRIAAFSNVNHANFGKAFLREAVRTCSSLILLLGSVTSLLRLGIPDEPGLDLQVRPDSGGEKSHWRRRASS